MAGFDTTATTLSFFLFNIANNPQCQERLLAEIDDVIGDGVCGELYEKCSMRDNNHNYTNNTSTIPYYTQQGLV